MDDNAGAEAPSSDVAFSQAVKEAQSARGSRRRYERVEERGGWRREIDETLAVWLAERDSFFLATASADGQPYIQHRGGPKGFLKVLDKKTLGFADYAGNKQYITVGNLSENDRVQIIALDQANRQRIKIWGRARVVEDDDALLSQLMPADYQAKPERAIVIAVTAWDVNCPQHITPRYSEAEIAPAVAKLARRIEELESELAELRAGKD